MRLKIRSRYNLLYRPRKRSHAGTLIYAEHPRSLARITQLSSIHIRVVSFSHFYVFTIRFQNVYKISFTDTDSNYYPFKLKRIKFSSFTIQVINTNYQLYKIIFLKGVEKFEA